MSPSQSCCSRDDGFIRPLRGVEATIPQWMHYRGVAGVVGCVNPRVKQDWAHVELVRRLVENDVLVVQTGCSQIALAKAGLCTPEAAYYAGAGLREVCEAVGMPPVLGMGACVDNSRILMACSEDDRA